LVSLVRFALEQQPVLAPFADSVSERFSERLIDKAKSGSVFTLEQLTWLNLIRDHIAPVSASKPTTLIIRRLVSKVDSAEPINSSATNCRHCLRN
jgi:hypothetical protein